jgi:mannose-1-phosphate guanylyltransferase
MLCALVLAGGKGERFWPLSTDKKPKQFLKLLGEDTMIQLTVQRLNKIIPYERIFIVTSQNYIEFVEEQLPEIPKKNIIAEPVGRNTAPCTALSAFTIEKHFSNPTVVVVPSDHLISDEDKFINSIVNAYNYVDKNENAIVTIGIKPDRPETGYGYIQYDNSFSNNGICSVNKFVEKPNLEKAKEYINNGNFLWNSGMFIWKTKNILKLTKKYLNNTYEILREIAITNECSYKSVLNEKYSYVDNISVDYGIMENVEEMYVISGDFGWDDIGTWQSLERYWTRDANNNISIGDIRTIDGSNNIIYGNIKPIVVVGLNQIFVVENDDIIFIGSKENIDNIKEIKQMLKTNTL